METRYGLGLNPVVHYPDEKSWANEKSPSEYILATMRRAYEDLLSESPEAALNRLSSVSQEAFNENPSFTMRRHYFQALAHFQLAEKTSETESPNEYHSACVEFKRALDIAIKGTDTASQVTILRMLAEAYHNLMKYDLALSEFLTALLTLQRFPPSDIKMQSRAEIALYSRLARQQFLLGQFNNTLDNIEKARKIQSKFGGPVVNQWDRAGEEWLEALVIRAESQRCGGDITMLRSAMRLFKSAEKRLDGDEEHQSSLRRLYIQIAETHLDLAEVYKSMGNEPSYKTNLRLAELYAIQASDVLRHTNDSAGKALTTLALLRLDHLSLKAYELPSRIHAVKMGSNSIDPEERVLASRIYDVEQMAISMNDIMLIARAATLRADVLAFKHDYAAALAVYYTAIAAFEKAGARGESTRAVYGVRQVLEIV